MEEIYKKVAEELNLPEDVVKEAYESFYKFLRESITKLPLKEDLTEEEFSKLKTNFNLPSLGKLHCTYSRYLGMKERLKYLTKIREKRNEHQED